MEGRTAGADSSGVIRSPSVQLETRSNVLKWSLGDDDALETKVTVGVRVSVRVTVTNDLLRFAA